MPVLLSREKSKYGSGVGTIICWPVELTSTSPNNEDNIRKLPAGYLKCDGTVYKAEEYPQLAEILGTGLASKFARRDISDQFIDTVDEDEFVVPDLGSKFLKPTTGGSAGLYINIVKNDQSGQERRRSGMGIESSAIAGTTTGNTTVIPVSYTGNFTVPSQEIPLQGKPAWSKGTGGFTDSEAVDSQALHAHMHFSQTNRLRIKTTNEITQAQAQGVGSYYNATTIPIEMWLDKTRYNQNASNPKGTNQQPCWAIASGAASKNPSDAVESSFGFEVVWSNYCYDLRGAAGLNSMRYYCLLTANTDFNLSNITNPGNPPNFISFGLGFGTCSQQDSGDDPNEVGTVPATYVAGAAGVPEDWKGVSLADVLPLNQNSDSKSGVAYPQVNNVLSDVEELVQTTGDPTIHNHKILLDIGTHTYKIKTNGFLLSPDNLQTTLTLQIDQVASLDQVTSPYIIMEYLIKY